MSVEQTTQLIQLILNSILMSVACALVLSGLTVRHAAIGDRLGELSRLDTTPDRERDFVRSQPILARKQLRRWQTRHLLSRYSVLVAYYALFFSGLSCFTLALRGILDWNWLISVALAVFVFGIAALLVAVGLTLMEIHLSDSIAYENRPLRDEASNLWRLGKQPSLRTHSRRPIKKSLGTLGQRIKIG
jgi:hypothetical protein